MYIVQINGQRHQTQYRVLKPILDELNLTQGRYAVEIDGELVPKSELNSKALQQGMVIEVVQAVGGG